MTLKRKLTTAAFSVGALASAFATVDNIRHMDGVRDQYREDPRAAIVSQIDTAQHNLYQAQRELTRRPGTTVVVPIPIVVAGSNFFVEPDVAADYLQQGVESLPSEVSDTTTIDDRLNGMVLTLNDGSDFPSLVEEIQRMRNQLQDIENPIARELTNERRAAEEPYGTRSVLGFMGALGALTAAAYTFPRREKAELK